MKKCLAACLGALAVVPSLRAQEYQEKVRVDLVTVDLVATDTSGKSVRDLRKEDLALRIDGSPVAVESFQPYSFGSEAAHALPASVVGEPIPHPSKETALQAHRLVILIDANSMSLLSQHDMRRKLIRFIEAGVPPGVQVRLERLQGRTLAVYPWTSDRDELRRALYELSSGAVFHRVPGINEREEIARDARHRFASIDEYALDSVVARSTPSSASPSFRAGKSFSS